MKTQEPKYVVNVNLPVQLTERLDALARERKTTRTALIREAVEKMI